MKETFLERCRRILKEDGVRGFIRKGFRALLRMFEPLRAAYYPYASWKLSRETNKEYTAEAAVDFALNRFGGFIRPTQVRSEILSLTKVVEKARPKTVLEIGTSKGGTLFVWARMAATDAHLVSIDLPGAEGEWVYPTYPRWKEPLYRKFASKTQRIDLLRGNSQTQEMVERLKKILGGAKVDFLFIDADHTYEGVKNDYELYSPFVRSGGIIAFHDIAEQRPVVNSGPKVLWEQIKTGKHCQEFIEDAGQGWGGIGVLSV